MHKQQKRVLNHLQDLWKAVGFSGKSRKIVTQKSVHALDGVRVCFSSEMFGRVDEIVGMPVLLKTDTQSKVETWIKNLNARNAGAKNE